MQLQAYGGENNYLNGNPELTFFKSVYRRYSNFSMELISLNLDGPSELSNDSEIKLSCKIDRSGDLLSNMYFVFTLPDIFSGYDDSVSESNAEHSLYKFRWIQFIGTEIIKTATLTIGGNKISVLYGSWIRIWHEMFSKTNVDLFNEMTGNVGEMFMPDFSNGYNNEYPTSTLSPDLTSDPASTSFSAYSTNPYLRPPSIRGRKIIVPLNFWFSENPGLSLPLLALQYHEVYIDIELRRLSELYTIVETDETSSDFKKRVSPNVLNDKHHMMNFITNISPSKFTYGEDFSVDTYTGWSFDPYIDVNYTFLGEEERTRFVDVSHSYLIHQVQRHEFLGLKESETLDLFLNNPVKSIIWMGVRDDYEAVNKYGNYTKWELEVFDEGALPYLRVSVGETTIDEEASGTVITDSLMEEYEANTICHKFNYTEYGQDIFKSARLMFNGISRFESRTGDYFNHLQNLQHKTTNWIPGVLCYHFSLNPTDIQPSGACNMSMVKSVQLEIELSDIPKTVNSEGETEDSYLYNVYVYTVGYNVLRILGGMGASQFVS